MIPRLGLILILVLCPLTLAYAQERVWDEQKDGPLPHWDTTGKYIPDPVRLTPYSISLGSMTGLPKSGVIDSPSEYDLSAGIIFKYSSYAWSKVVTDCVVAITGDPSKDDRVWVVVDGAVQQTAAVNQFTAAGADMSKVEFMDMQSETIWLRDYGPSFIIHDGAHSIVDAHYYILQRYLDNFTPTQIGEDYFQIPVYHMGLNSSAGGNFLPGPNRCAYVSDMVSKYNPGFTPQYIASMYQDYLGIDTLHIFPELPQSVDLTGHIDMWMFLVNDNTAIISEFVPGSNPTAIQITDNAVTYMQNLGYTVHRVVDHVGSHTSGYNTHYTYTNAITLNDRILIPSFGGGDPSKIPNDNAALAVFQAAAPGFQIIQIPCYDIIWAAGALHCISMNVPLRADPVPAVHLCSPDGGELLVSGTNHELVWAACDDDQVTGVDLYYSLDNGATFPHLIASGLNNDSKEDWTVPFLPSHADQAVVKVKAKDGSNQAEDVSYGTFQIREAKQKVYDFSVNPGVDRWGWGSATNSWNDLDGNRYPASASTPLPTIDRAAYAKLAASDATGGKYDVFRYKGPAPSYQKEGTHIFEFVIQEEPDAILDISILWEGFGDACAHMEVYVWDNGGQNWSNGAGLLGDNMSMCNYAGNRDDVLEGHIRDNFDRYVDANQKLTLLIYTDRNAKETYHDYIAVKVTYEDALSADYSAVSASQGAIVDFKLNGASVHGGKSYILFGNATGTSPGLLLPGGKATLPINWDSATNLILSLTNTAFFPNFAGVLNPQGNQNAGMNTFGPLPSNTVGLVLNFAYALNFHWDFASNPVSIEIKP